MTCYNTQNLLDIREWYEAKVFSTHQITALIDKSPDFLWIRAIQE